MSGGNSDLFSTLMGNQYKMQWFFLFLKLTGVLPSMYVYENELQFFAVQWKDVLHDDPY